MPLATLGFLAVLATALAGAARPAFDLHRIPTPRGCQAYAGWHGLSDEGFATLVLSCEQAPHSRAVLWTGASLPLGSLGGSSVTPYGVARGGIVLGASGDGSETSPVIWDDGVPRDLGTLGGPHGGALAANARGTIVGGCQAGEVEPSLHRRPIRACVWTDSGVRDLGDLGGAEASAYDINGRGWVVGSSLTPLPHDGWFEEHAFLVAAKPMRDLGTLGGPQSYAWALNERGDVVGMSYTTPSRTGELTFHAFLWRRNVLQDLGTLGGTMSEAIDVNDDGAIVGWSQLAKGDGVTSEHAVLWREGVPLDLNDLVDDAKGCVLMRALAINGGGSILADARCPDGDQVVVLKPQ